MTAERRPDEGAALEQAGKPETIVVQPDVNLARHEALRVAVPEAAATDGHSAPGLGTLDPVHRASLRSESAISDAIIDGRGYATVTEDCIAALRSVQGFGDHQVSRPRMPALLIPMYATHPRSNPALWQLRPFGTPRMKNGKPIKYETPAGSRPILDCHPANLHRLADPATRLWITEGVKKADSLATKGEVALAMPGVWNWRGRNGHGGKAALGAFEEFPLDGRTVYLCFDSDVEDNRHVREAMRRLGGLLRNRGSEVWFVWPARTGAGKSGVDDFFAAGGSLEELIARAMNSLDSIDGADIPIRHVIATIADTIADTHRYVPEWHRWVHYDESGGRWVRDSDTNYVASTVRRQLEEHAQEARTAAERSGWLSWDSPHRVETIVKGLNQLVDVFNVVPAVFDADPELLNCANGVVKLATGELLPHHPDFFMLHSTGVEYHPMAVSGDWVKALEALDDAVVVHWLQVVVGHAITGHTDLDLFVVFDGGGSNGKTTLLEAWGAALGDYADPVSPKLFMRGSTEHATIEADLHGRRLVWAAETEDGAILNMEKVKSLTGGDKRKARRMREDYWSFDPTHSLFLATNHRPQVTSSDHGTWRRMRLVPFPCRYVAAGDIQGLPFERLGDPTLRARLRQDRANREAVLAWLVRGAWKYLRTGVPGTPPAVAAMTAEWRAEEDVLASFLTEDGWHLQPGLRVARTDLYNQFKVWCEDSGRRAWSSREFYKQLFSRAASSVWPIGEVKSSTGERQLDGIARDSSAPATDWANYVHPVVTRKEGRVVASMDEIRKATGRDW